MAVNNVTRMKLYNYTVEKGPNGQPVKVHGQLETGSNISWTVLKQEGSVVQTPDLTLDLCEGDMPEVVPVEPEGGLQLVRELPPEVKEAVAAAKADDQKDNNSAPVE